MAVETTTTKWKVDITDFKAAMSEADRAIKLANSEFKAASSALGAWGKETEGVRAKIAQLDKVLEAQERKAQALREEYERVAKEQGEGSKAAEELKIKLNNQEAVVNKTKNELTKYNGKLVEMESETKKSESALGKLTDEIDSQEKELKDLKIQYKNIVLEQGEESDAAKDVKAQIEKLSGELNDNKKKLADAEKAADSLGDELEETGKDAKEANEGFTIFKGTLANLAAEAIKAAISGLKDLGRAAVDAYKEFDEGQDAVITATGATGEAAAELSASYKAVAKNVVGNLGDIGKALGEVNTRFGFTGAQLEDTTTQFVKFADITGTDATTAVRLVSRAMESANIPAEEYGELLDALAVAGQASGISVDRLAENLTKNGSTMRSMGLDTKESVALLAQFEKAGVNSEAALAGMRKSIVSWSKSGKNARTEFNKVLDSIKAAPNATEASRIAIENFGTKAGTELAEAIKTGRFEYQSFLELIEGSAGTVNKTYEETQDGFDRINLAVQGVRADMGEFVGELFDKYQPQIEQIIEAVSGGIQTLLEGIIKVTDFVLDHMPAVTAALAGIAAFGFAKKISGLSGAISSLLPNATGLVGVLTNPAFALVAGVIAAITAAIVLYNVEAAKGTKEIRKFREENDELQKTLGKVSDKYGDFVEGMKKEAEEIEGSFMYTERLWTRLQELVDSNGNVTAGKEAEAKLIMEELNRALGLELELVDGQIQGYKELAAQIDDVINKKKLEALMSAYQDDYTTALKEQAAGAKALSDAEGVLISNKELQAKKQAEYNALLEKTQGLSDVELEANRGLVEALGRSKRELEEVNTTVKESQAAYDEAANAVGGYASMIENYESAQLAYAEGNADAIAKANTKLQSNLQSASTGTTESLKRQAEEYEAFYERQKKAYERGDISERQMKDAERAAKYTAEQYKLSINGLSESRRDALTQQIKADREAQKQNKLSYKTISKTIASGSKEAEKEAIKGGTAAGQASGNSFVKGLGGTSGAVKAAGVGVSKEGAAGAASFNYTPTGKNKATEFGKGVESQKSAVQATGKAVSEAGAAGAASADWKSKASAKVSEFAAKLGDSESLGKVKTNAGTLSNAVTSTLGGIDLTKAGESASSQYAQGIKNKAGEVTSAAAGVSADAEGTQGFGAANMTGRGEAAGSQYKGGIEGQKGEAQSAASGVAAAAEGAQGFGSANMTGRGEAAGGQYASGITGSQGTARAAGAGVANAAVAGASSVDTKSVGSAMGSGVASGIETQREAVINKFKNLVEAAVAKAKEALGISSPSKVTREMGGFLMEGLALGIEDEASLAEDAMVDAMNDIIKAAEGAKAGLSFATGAFGASAAPKTPAPVKAGNSKVINYTQNNYSPKSLSRLDIYQQTQRQLAAEGGM